MTYPNSSQAQLSNLRSTERRLTACGVATLYALFKAPHAADIRLESRVQRAQVIQA